MTDSHQQQQELYTPETNIVPENGWLEYYVVSFSDGLFSGAQKLYSHRAIIQEIYQRCV